MNDKDILEKIIKYCDMLNETIENFGSNFEKFKLSHIYQNSTCMCILQIGELCKYLKNEFRNKYTEIDWKGWCGMRDVFAHQYGKLNLESTWETISKEYPQFDKKIREIYTNI